jgi:hypothetical protein
MQPRRFGTVRPRVQIPGPRPISYSKSTISYVVWSQPHTAVSQFPADLRNRGGVKGSVAGNLRSRDRESLGRQRPRRRTHGAGPCVTAFENDRPLASRITGQRRPRAVARPSRTPIVPASRRTSAVATFSSRCFRLDVPGISRMFGSWARSQARPTWAAVAP